MLRFRSFFGHFHPFFGIFSRNFTHKTYSYTPNLRTCISDLSLTCTLAPNNGLICRFLYNSAVFRPSTIKRWADYYEKLLFSICENPAQKIDLLEILPKWERWKMIRAWNDTETGRKCAKMAGNSAKMAGNGGKMIENGTKNTENGAKMTENGATNIGMTENGAQNTENGTKMAEKAEKTAHGLIHKMARLHPTNTALFDAYVF
jgi:hypothetical protein